MNILVTAGNTQVSIDRVRCLTNVFTGRTGTAIALLAQKCGHAVTLLTSHPDVVAQLLPAGQSLSERWKVLGYRSFTDLESLLHEQVTRHTPDALVHSAAVSDYGSGGIFAPAPHTRFDGAGRTWVNSYDQPPELVDVSAGKVKSDAPELWLRLVRTPKLIDAVRKEWGYAGLLVKFKLEVGVTESQLLDIAERSRLHSDANLMVANTLEGAGSWAYLGPVDGAYQRIPREELSERLLQRLEQLAAVRQHG